MKNKGIIDEFTARQNLIRLNTYKRDTKVPNKIGIEVYHL